MAIVTKYVANVRLGKTLNILNAIQTNMETLWKEVGILSKLNKNIEILDVGCGNCYILESIRDKGYDIVGIDIDSPQTCPWMPHYPDFVMDATKMTFGDNSFDVVICFEVVEHVNCISEIRRVLKKGGLFICSTPTEGSDWVRHLLIKLHLLQDQDFGAGHELFVDLTKLKGFDLLSYQKMFLGTSQFGVFKKC